jgi:tRNA(fMet)-specific endonuclease VapC
MKYFLDTNICIYHLNGKYKKATEKISLNRENIYMPAIVVSELIYGAYKSGKSEFNIKRYKTFIKDFKIVNFNEKAAYEYAKIRTDLERAGTPIGANDLFIAATVIANGGILITNNTEEFSRIDNLSVEDWTI